MAYAAYARDNRGYDLSLFETTKGTAVPKEAPTKVKKKNSAENIVKLQREDTLKAQRRKHNVPALIVGFVMSAIAKKGIFECLLAVNKYITRDRKRKDESEEEIKIAGEPKPWSPLD